MVISEVSSSAEVEQEAEQQNGCTDAGCENIILLQEQGALAEVVNIGGHYEDVTNSAEIEQEAEQENECTDAFCGNFVQSRTDSLLLL